MRTDFDEHVSLRVDVYLQPPGSVQRAVQQHHKALNVVAGRQYNNIIIEVNFSFDRKFSFYLN